MCAGRGTVPRPKKTPKKASPVSLCSSPLLLVEMNHQQPVVCGHFTLGAWWRWRGGAARTLKTSPTFSIIWPCVMVLIEGLIGVITTASTILLLRPLLLLLSASRSTTPLARGNNCPFRLQAYVENNDRVAS